MTILYLPKKIIKYIKKNRFIRQFKYCARTSGFGNNGYGDGCVVIGKENMYIGENTWFGTGCEVYAYNSHLGQKLTSCLSVGNNVRITARCRITCAGETVIGNDVLIAPDVFITDHNHGMNPEVSGGYSPQALIVKNVHIDDGVWLGQRVTVLPGVVIGKHSIIGANSVVTHSIPEYCMAVGNPARVIKRWNHATKEWEKI